MYKHIVAGSPPRASRNKQGHQKIHDLCNQEPLAAFRDLQIHQFVDDIKIPRLQFNHKSTARVNNIDKMSVMNRNMPLATSAAAAPGLLTQVGMAGTAAVITVR
jgi:hypothetical protein